MERRDFFLLDPDNELFATGARAKLPAGGHGCILLFMGIFVLAGLESYLHGDGRATSALLWTWQVPFEESIGVIAAGGSSQDLPGHPRTRAQHEPLAAGAVSLG